MTCLPYTESELRVKITEAIGAGSACWDNLRGAGVFESERAAQVAQTLIGDVLKLTKLGEANLGLATNAELTAELEARQRMGHTDPEYRTLAY